MMHEDDLSNGGTKLNIPESVLQSDILSLAPSEKTTKRNSNQNAMILLAKYWFLLVWTWMDIISNLNFAETINGSSGVIYSHIHRREHALRKFRQHDDIVS